MWPVRAGRSLAPLVEGVLELGRRWITFDGRLVETRAGLVAAAARRWEEAERHFGIAREVAEQMCNRLELADLGRLAGPDAAGPRRQWRPRARRRDASGGFVRISHVWHALPTPLRRNAYNVRPASSGVARAGEQRCRRLDAVV